MSITPRRWIQRFSELFRKEQMDRELDEELASHLEMHTEENVRRGMTAEEARRNALIKLGGIEQTKESHRDSRGMMWLETLVQDMRFGLRMLRKNPRFTAVAVLTLALGIGPNTAIFNLVYSVLLRPLPYPHGERLIVLSEEAPRAKGISVTWTNFQHWRNENHTLDELAGFDNTDMTLTGRGDAALTHAGVITSSFFQLTGWKPMLGRLFTADDDKPGAAPAVVLSGEFWHNALGGNPEVMGSMLRLNEKEYQVVGVLPPGLRFFSRPVDYYVSLGPAAGKTLDRSKHGSMRVLGLLKSSVSATMARSDLNTIMQRLAVTDPGPEDDHRVFAESLSERNTQGIRATLFMLMAAVGLVLLLACANVASLLLVRGITRAREFSIRAAIGAGRGRLVRQLLAENFVTAALGGLLGLILAQGCLKGLMLFGPKNFPGLSDVHVDTHVLLFAGLISTVVGALAAIVPAWTAGKIDLVRALSEGSAAAGAGRKAHSIRSALVVAEIAITLMLLFSSGLLVRSLVLAENSFPGFMPEHLLALELQVPPARYSTPAAVRQFYGGLMEKLKSEPSLESVAAVNCPPSAGDCEDYWYSVLELPAPSRGDVPLSLFNIVDNSYFRTMGIPLRAGREFNDSDRESGAPVMLINESVARKWWTNPREAVGHHVKLGGPYMEGATYEIVGLVGDASQEGLDSVAMPEMYFAFSQKPSEAMVVMMRTSGDPSAIIPAVRRDLASMDTNVPIQSLKPFEKWLGATLEQRRFGTLLLEVFAALAMILASVGIYGLLNYWVSVRQKEIGIRLAMGAKRVAILSWAGSNAIRLILIGIVLGVLGAWSASNWLAHFVFGISAKNPLMMLAAGVGVLAIAAIAAFAPLWRAALVDPMIVLRYE